MARQGERGAGALPPEGPGKAGALARRAATSVLALIGVLTGLAGAAAPTPICTPSGQDPAGLLSAMPRDPAGPESCPLPLHRAPRGGSGPSDGAATSASPSEPVERPALAGAAGRGSLAESPSPVAVVHAFYAFHFAHDMGFTEASVRARAPWLAPDLLARCAAYFKKPVPSDAVPDIDGDPFTDSQEYPGAFHVEEASVTGPTALVPVVMSWTDRRRSVRVELRVVSGAWRITDVLYEGGQSFRKLLAGGA